jgi:hypothetical protein
MCCVCGRLSELSEFLSLAIPMLNRVRVGCGKSSLAYGYALPASVDIDRFNTVAIYSVGLHAVFRTATLDAF